MIYTSNFIPLCGGVAASADGVVMKKMHLFLDARSVKKMVICELIWDKRVVFCTKVSLSPSKKSLHIKAGLLFVECNIRILTDQPY